MWWARERNLPGHCHTVPGATLSHLLWLISALFNSWYICLFFASSSGLVYFLDDRNDTCLFPDSGLVPAYCREECLRRIKCDWSGIIKCQSSESSWQAKQMMSRNYEKYKWDSQVELYPTQLSPTYTGSCMKRISSLNAQVFPAKSTSSGSVFPLHCTSKGKTFGIFK